MCQRSQDVSRDLAPCTGETVARQLKRVGVEAMERRAVRGRPAFVPLEAKGPGMESAGGTEQVLWGGSACLF